MRQTALIFPGQGSQFPEMGKDIYVNFKLAQETYEEASDNISKDIKKITFENPDNLLNMTEYAQPAILTLSIAILRILRAESNYFTNHNNFITAGHSLGEFSAITASMSLDFADAIKLVHARGQFMQEASTPGKGAMAAIIGLKEEKLIEICKQNSNENSIVVPANFNTETQIVISGHKEAVDKAIALATASGAKVIPLAVSIPSHCPILQTAAEKMDMLLQDTPFKPLTIPYIANFTATLYNDISKADIVNNLTKQIVSPVRWKETMDIITNQNIDEVIEVGPGKVLAGLWKKTYRTKSFYTSGTMDALNKVIKEKN